MSDTPTPETARFQVGICPVTGQQYRVPRTEDEWEALASRLERERDEARDEAAKYKAWNEESKANAARALHRADRENDELRAEVERLRGALEGVLPIFVGKFLRSEEHVKVAFAREALWGKEGE